MRVQSRMRSMGIAVVTIVCLAGGALANPLDEPQSPAPPTPAARTAQQAFDEGNRQMEAKRFPEATAAFRQAVKARPDFAEAHSNLGYSLRNSGRVDEAIAAYQEAIRLKPDLAEAYEYLGCAYLMQGDRQAAQEQHRILQRLNPKLAAELMEEILRAR